MKAQRILSTQDNRGELMFQRLEKIKTFLSTLEEVEDPDEPSENDKAEQQDTQENDDEKVTSEQPTAPAHKYTNVTFPRGFSPSQCSLLASRQRSANYLYFSTNERGEFLSNENPCQSVKTPKRKKKKNKSTRNHVISSAQLESRYLKPVLPVSDPNETMSRSSFSQLARIHAKTGFESGSITMSSLKSGQTSQTGLKSKEEIAKHLAKHAQELLKIQSSETIAEIQRVERTLYYKRSKNCSRPPELPVYLFKKRPTLPNFKPNERLSDPRSRTQEIKLEHK